MNLLNTQGPVLYRNIRNQLNILVTNIRIYLSKNGSQAFLSKT